MHTLINTVNFDRKFSEMKIRLTLKLKNALRNNRKSWEQ